MLVTNKFLRNNLEDGKALGEFEINKYLVKSILNRVVNNHESAIVTPSITPPLGAIWDPKLFACKQNRRDSPVITINGYFARGIS